MYFFSTMTCVLSPCTSSRRSAESPRPLVWAVTFTGLLRPMALASGSRVTTGAGDTRKVDITLSQQVGNDAPDLDDARVRVAVHEMVTVGVGGEGAVVAPRL